MEYNKNNPLRVVTLCSGYDSQCLALEMLKEAYPEFDYELVAWAEFDPESSTPIEKQPAVMAHNALFPQWADRNLGDMTKIDWHKVPDFDCLTYSTPCFIKGTMVHTNKGYKPIEEVKVGDMVLTHTNSYKSVVTPMCHIHKGDLIKIRAMAFDEITCTPEHPFYVRKKKRVGHDWHREFSAPEWVLAKDLCKGDYKTADYLGFAINQNAELPQWNGTTDNRWGHNKHTNKLTPMFSNKNFWYLMGRYVGDGWKRESNFGNSVIICCSDRNEQTLIDCLNSLEINFNKSVERTVYKYHIHSNELFLFVERYGYKALGKCIDEETINLPTDLLSSFLDGYLDSDGSRFGNNYKITTISRLLAYGVAQCVAKVYKQPVKIYYNKRQSKYTIEGREVNQHDTYQVVWKTEKCKQDNAFYEDGCLWYPIKEITTIHNQEIEVYNLEVEDDHSYTANNAIVHNCQSISQAGLQHGFKEGSGTRSSIIWNVRDALRIKHPKYALLENVSAMVSQKFLPMFNLWRSEIYRLGYENFAKVLNAKNYGVPQNRERIFLFSIYDPTHTATYHFPEPMKLEKTLTDLLEDNVDKKYYLSYAKVDKFVKENKKKILEYAHKSNEPILPLPFDLKEMIDNAKEDTNDTEQQEA